MSPGRVLVGGTGVRQVTLGGAVSGPLPGLPGHGQLVTTLVAGPGAGYAFDTPCFSSTASVRLYRIVAGAAHRLRITADALLGGPHHAWAVTYRPRAVRTLVLIPGGRAVTFNSNITPVADTTAGLVVAAYHPPASRRPTIKLLDPDTAAVLRRLGGGSPLGAADHVLLVSLHGCAGPPAHGTCTLESIDLTTGRRAATVELPTGRVPVSGDLASPVFSPDGTLAAFQLTRARPDPRFAAAAPRPPSDVAVLHLRTGRLDIVPGLELPPHHLGRAGVRHHRELAAGDGERGRPRRAARLAAGHARSRPGDQPAGAARGGTAAASGAVVVAHRLARPVPGRQAPGAALAGTRHA